MLIPSIDLQDGRVVQLVQGARLAIASDDLDGWVERFLPFPLVQVIDLDAAMRRGTNTAIVRRLCTRLPCQVGGGVRTPDSAKALLDVGARRVILGSSLFDRRGVRLDTAGQFARHLDPDRLIAAVDSRGGQVTINGWKTTLPITAADAARQLTPYVGGFLYTHVDTEGTLQGLNADAVARVRNATPRRLIAAGGIRTLDEVAALHARGIDAVVGMALYTGAIDLDAAVRTYGTSGNSSSDDAV